LDVREIEKTNGGFLLEYNLLVVDGIFALGFYNGYHSV
jgi:hypothetical protein